MFKLFNLFTWVTDLVENFTFYGGGGKGGSSSSTAQDFFGVGKRAPYENLLSQLLLGGTVGGTAGHYENGGGGGNQGGQWISVPNGYGGTTQQWVPLSSGGKGGGKKGSGAWIPGTDGFSLTDFVKMQPGYQFQYNQGLDALNRQFAATGVGLTGAQSIALQDYGNKYAAQSLQQLIGNLLPASGATISPASNSQSQGASPIPGALATLGAAWMMA